MDSVIVRLIIVNVVVFFLQFFPATGAWITRYLALTPRDVLTRGYVWQLITYMFLHGGLWHIGINMFIIWMFGRTLEQIWGSARFLRFFFICGIGGALLSFIFAYNTRVIGASAGGYGILLAFAILFPNQRLLIFPFFIPIKARTLVIALAMIELLMGVAGGGGIAHFAHLGGMAAALIMLRGEYQLRRINSFIRDRLSKLPVKIILDRDGDESQKGGKGGDERIDSILDKISEKGYENLTETERRILEKYSEDSRSGGDDPTAH